MKKFKQLFSEVILDSFKVGLPDTALTKYQLDKATKNYVYSTFKSVIIVSILFIIAQVYYLIYDCVSGNFTKEMLTTYFQWMALFAEILLLTCSCITLTMTTYVYASNNKENTGLQKAIIRFYYFIIAVGCSFFIMAKILRFGGLMNIHSSLIYVILLLAVCPSYSRKQNLTCIIILLISITIPLIIVKSKPSIIPEPSDLSEINGFGWYINCLLFLIFGAIVSEFSYASQMRSKMKSVVLTEANELLKQKTETDELTQVANRRAMNMYIELKENEWKEESKGVAFIMLDIDFFKKYNDFYGHLRGDECLKRVAQAASLAAQLFNGTVYRYGGEEFVVIAENIDEAQALQLCKEIHREIGKLKISHEGINGDKETMLTVSIGLNYETSFRRAPNLWILDADQQLYYAKHEGRNCTAYRNALYNTYHKPAKGEEAKDHF